nr:MAG TPA: hypothetical protein [Caudoviricetes sp.]DAV90653.1 MAG TPA: hypothetical protein [Caudoviricetes sp.]DAX86638.1 MAG TPA: hypothetical protein [Caudoviricetes sp.]
MRRSSHHEIENNSHSIPVTRLQKYKVETVIS